MRLTRIYESFGKEHPTYPFGYHTSNRIFENFHRGECYSQ